MEPYLISERELANTLGLSYWTVRTMRLQEGLPFIKSGSRVFYRLDKVKEWMTKQEEQNSQAHAKPKRIPCHYSW